MDKKIVGLLGAVAGLATVGTAQADIQPTAQSVPRPASYAELLAPIPNAVQALKADDAARAEPNGSNGVELTQWWGYYGYYHHHHRHHHHHHRR